MRDNDLVEAQRRIRSIRELMAQRGYAGGGGLLTERRGHVRSPHERDWTAPYLDAVVREALEGPHQAVRVVRWYPLDENAYVAVLSTGAVVLAELVRDEAGVARVLIQTARRPGPEDRMP